MYECQRALIPLQKDTNLESMRTECRGEYLVPGMKTWDRKLLRNVYGPVVEQGIWRVSNDQELRKLYEV
jgi:hypothetical protein